MTIETSVFIGNKERNSSLTVSHFNFNWVRTFYITDQQLETILLKHAEKFLEKQLKVLRQLEPLSSPKIHKNHEIYMDRTFRVTYFDEHSGWLLTLKLGVGEQEDLIKEAYKPQIEQIEKQFNKVISND